VGLAQVNISKEHMENLNGVPNISLLKDSSGLGYLSFRKKLAPTFYKVWIDMALCLLMMALPALFFKEAAGNSLIVITLIPLCALWSAYWIHAYGCFFHEGAHFNLHKNKLTNDMISNLLLTPFFGMLVKSYRVSHWEHHKHLGTGKDTEISYLSALSITNLLQVFLGIYHLKTIIRYIQNFKSVGSQAHRNSKSTIFLFTLIFAVIVQVAIASLMFIYISPAAGLSWAIAYFILYPMLAKIRQTLEHRSLDVKIIESSTEHGAVHRIFGTDSFSNYFGAAGFNRHLIHHYDPSISYTNFDELEFFLKDTSVAEELFSNRTTYTKTFLNMLER